MVGALSDACWHVKLGGEVVDDLNCEPSQFGVGHLRPPHQDVEGTLGGDAVCHHQHALGLFDHSAVLCEIGDRVLDSGGAIVDIAEVHVQALGADHGAVTVAQPLGNYRHGVDVATRVDDAVTTGERPALFGHR